MVRAEPQPEPPAQPRPERGAGADREQGKEHACLLRLGAGRRTKIRPTVPRGIRQASSAARRGGSGRMPSPEGLNQGRSGQLALDRRRTWTPSPVPELAAVVREREHQRPALDMVARVRLPLLAIAGSSEEHTSALQSLMRLSYAVFCLK